MPADRRLSIPRHRGALVAGVLSAALAVPAVSARGAASVSPASSGVASLTTGVKSVSYRGYRFQVPRSWPVIDLAAHPAACVRFDRHAVYLGAPGANQSCPSGLVGSTEAMVIQPAGQRTTGSVEDPVARRITVTTTRISVTATYRSDRNLILAILASAGLAQPAVRTPAVMAPGAPGTVSQVPLTTTSDIGQGFDACAAPSPQHMRAWLADSPYRAIGIYIGGSDRACAQPNLTAAWVSEQTAAGWHFIPLYVGPQVAFRGEVTSPASQAVSAAQDAVARAQLLGFGPGSPIYYDMEGYHASRAQTALTFFSAWSSELHVLGYRSGIYSSSHSGVSDLAASYSGHTYTMPDVIYDAWWNGAANTTDPNIPAGDWVDHQRIHQYAGNVTQIYGGARITIDKDYLDVRVGALEGSGTRQASPAVAIPTGVDAFFAGSGGALWSVTNQRQAGWSPPKNLGGSQVSQPSAVATAGGGVEAFFRVGNGGLQYVTTTSPGNWTRPLPLRVGALGGAPVAVSTRGGAIDVFWRGRDTTRLWSAEFRPGTGWSRPVYVAGGLASAPSPAVSGSGTISVFWRGTDGRLWYTSHRPGRAWKSPALLAVGRLGSAPAASGQGNGTIGVFWRGSRRPSTLWHATYTPGHGWSGNSRLHGGAAASGPFPVAAAGSTETVVWSGTDGRLWQASAVAGGGWHSSSAAMGRLAGAPFAAAEPGGIVDVFWKGSSGALWQAGLKPASATWTGPQHLGGSVGRP